MSDKASASRLQDRPALATAKPVSDAGSASGITYLRKGSKKLWGETAVKREE